MFTNFDYKRELAQSEGYTVERAGFIFEISSNDNIDDLVEQLREMATYLIENRMSLKKGIKTLMKAAEFFDIPESYVEDIWNEKLEELGYQKQYRKQA